jgi:urease accessory protein
MSLFRSRFRGWSVARELTLSLRRGCSLRTCLQRAGFIIGNRDGEAFAFDQLFSEFEVAVAGQSVLTDRLFCDTREEVQSLRHLWDGAANSALIAIRAPALPIDLEREIELVLPGPSIRSSGAIRKDDLILCRVLATEAWACQEAIFRAWTVMRPIIAQKPARPIRKC